MHSHRKMHLCKTQNTEHDQHRAIQQLPSSFMWFSEGSRLKSDWPSLDVMFMPWLLRLGKETLSLSDQLGIQKSIKYFTTHQHSNNEEFALKVREQVDS